MGAPTSSKVGKAVKEDVAQEGKADVLSMTHNRVRCAGADDGHFGIKVVTDDANGNMVQFYVPSRVASGASMISLNGGESNLYEVGAGDNYTVSETMPYIDTRFADYALSDINRVLVHHALIVAGLGGENVRLVSGLPVDDFFAAGKPNVSFIERKIANLRDKEIKNRNPDVKCAQIVGHSVQSEAIAAFYDLLIGATGEVNDDIKELVETGSIAIVDVGGKTTDFAVVINQGQGIDPARSGTAHLGALSLNKAVEEALKAEFGIDALAPTQVERAVQTSNFRVFGKDNDCSAIVNREKTLLADQIIIATKRKMRDAADLERVFFVGGGSALLGDQLKDLFPHAHFVADPQFANARGLYKIARFMMG